MPTTAFSAQPGVSPTGPARTSRPTNRFLQERESTFPSKMRAASASPLKLSAMSHMSLEHLIFSAMRHLPVPILVLNNSKTVVYANEAIGTLLGIARHSRDDNFEDFSDVQMKLRGETLCQVGIDMLQDGRLMWVSWDAFFDSIAKELRVNSGRKRGVPGTTQTPASASPSIIDNSDDHDKDTPTLASSPTQDIAVDVVICGKDLGKMSGDPTEVVGAYEHQIHATMIVTAWEFADKQTYFTLTFTQSDPVPVSLDAMGHGTTHDSARPPSRSASQSSVTSNNDAIILPSTKFPPAGPPSKSVGGAPLSHLQKLTKMKDVLLNSTEVPVFAMWKDGSAVFPNRASRKLCRQDVCFDDTLKGAASLENWDTYTEDFSRKLSLDEYPISILLRTEEPFETMRIGIYDKAGRRLIWDVQGELIRDDATGEVFAGLVSLVDVTRFTEEISEIKEHGEERFKQICNTMPQLVWTTTGDAKFDFFNIRWYEYTGLSFDLTIGNRWTTVLHPDDRAAVLNKWQYCMRTGEDYLADYRVRNKNGEYRWFLARANPLRDRETGEILKWFGTSTDVHEIMEASFAAKRMRQQLSTVITHCRVTLFTVNTDRRISMLEGALVRDTTGKGSPDYESQGPSDWYIGENVYDVFSRLGAGDTLEFLQPIDDVFAGKKANDTREYVIHDRCYRFEFIPLWGKASLESSGTYIEGAIGVAMDVTGQRRQEAALEEEAREKRQAIANETAAREANRLKSQFLANMSHEIRTPITGVLGMAEVLAAAIADKEQREYLGNIQRSASALLTVVNDILDFSKVESGRLDIEEVKFSLSSMVSGVRSMLNFIASRKDLNFQYDVPQEVQNGYLVIGDPGRVRQIIMNLLTNSIKFTDEGYVKFSVVKESETADNVTVRFAVEDSGIGMTNEVKSKLFQPFSQGDPSTARKFGGTGLGLTICKNLVELMGGWITLDSSPGKGTTANILIPFRKPSGREARSTTSIDTLSDRLQWEMSLMCNASDYEDMFGCLPKPAKEDEDTTRPPPQTPAEKVPNVMMPSVSEHELSKSERGDVHVLVVEDNAVNQRIATKFVTMLGFQVAAAWNGKEALDYIRDSLGGKDPKPSIILMDCQMPVVDGYKCTHALRHHAPFKAYAKDIPIIAMTASAIQGDREKCTRAGMDDYLSKPVRSKTLEKMLIKWSRTERPSNASPPACSEFSASDCPENLDHVKSGDTASLDLAGLEDSSLSSQASETPPVTPGFVTNGALGDGEGSWPMRRPSEDVAGPWSQMAENGDALAAQKAEEISERIPEKRKRAGT